MRSPTLNAERGSRNAELSQRLLTSSPTGRLLLQRLCLAEEVDELSAVAVGAPIVLTLLMSGALLPISDSQAAGALPPFIVTHGMQDGTLPIARGRALREYLLGVGAQVEYHEYDMQHEINEACLEDINAWLAARM